MPKTTTLQHPVFSATNALRDAVMALQRARIETASLDARLLLQHVLHISREQLLLGQATMLDEEQYHTYQALVEKRSQRQPLAQLIGRREFWDLSFKVTSATLDPRPDSETLIEAVLLKFKDRSAALKILDLGSGTGCLLLTLLHEYKQASGIGADICDETLSVARENAVRLDMEVRATFVKACWGEGVCDNAQFDIVISNPPYIPTDVIGTLAPEVRQYEPKLALDGGADGLDCYRAIMPKLHTLLKESGLAVFEIGMGQQRDLEAIAAAQGLKVIGIKDDMAGIPRCVLITR